MFINTYLNAFFNNSNIVIWFSSNTTYKFAIKLLKIHEWVTTRDIKVSRCKSARESTYLRATLSTRALHAPPPPQAPTKAHVTWHSRAALARPSELCYPRHTILVYRFFTELWHFAFNIVSTDRLKTKMCWLPSRSTLRVDGRYLFRFVILLLSIHSACGLSLHVTIFVYRYLRCVNEHMRDIQPFEDVPHKLSVQLRRAFVATRTFHKALRAGADVVRNMMQVHNSINNKQLTAIQPQVNK